MSGVRSSSSERPIPAAVGRLARRLGSGGPRRASTGMGSPRRVVVPSRLLRPRTLALLVAGLVLMLAGWFWLRDSSLVAVRTVEVSGVSGPQATSIRSALEEAARSMTTLHVRHDALDTAVAPFSLVKRVEAQTDFPHTLRLHVVTNVAVGAVVLDGGRIPVTSDGTLLRDVRAAATLPTIPVRAAPGGRRLTEPEALAAVAALGAAPHALRVRIERVTTTPEHGLAIQLAHGPVLWFGSSGRLNAKWAAAAAVLADPEAAGASSIDVTVPERPAVTGAADGAPATSESDLPTPPVGFDSTDPAATATPAPDATATTPDAGAAPAAP